MTVRIISLLLAGLLLLTGVLLLVGRDGAWPQPPLGPPTPPSYPQSPVFSGISWGSLHLYHSGNIKDGSDNWPATWHSDGHIYSAGGDGKGCVSSDSSKKSLRIVRVTGNPPLNHSCSNITSLDVPNHDHSGRRGKKGSGILSIDNRLYLWARNADRDGQGCQLAWSDNNGQDWTWGFTFDNFGYCTFLNFGQAYSGVPDHLKDNRGKRYVYTYTPDHPDAYKAADRFVLMRVPEDKVTDKNAYEFFNGTANNPSWTGNIGNRGGVFNYPVNSNGFGGAGRSGISYHAPSGRYLWAQITPKNGRTWSNQYDARKHTPASLGIYDAPEPWGPWTIVSYTEDLRDANGQPFPPGEAANFPTKWMNSNGTTAWYLSSERDDFALRLTTLAYQGDQ